MFWVIVCVIAILCLTGLAIFEVDKLRWKRLEKKLKLEIANLGNTDCRFQLRAEDASGGLSFQYLHNGVRLSEWFEDQGIKSSINTGEGLPAQVYASAPALSAKPASKPSSAVKGAQTAIKSSGVFASLLVAIGTLLPGSSGSKLMQTGTQITRTGTKATRIEQVAGQAASLKQDTQASVPTPTPVQAPIAAQPVIIHSGPAWAETPVIQPGKTSLIDLVIRSGWIKQNEARPFQIKSRATEKIFLPWLLKMGL